MRLELIAVPVSDVDRADGNRRADQQIVAPG
jgi:hypothetical protein